jgi:hypothetical protein
MVRISGMSGAEGFAPPTAPERERKAVAPADRAAAVGDRGAKSAARSRRRDRDSGEPDADEPQNGLIVDIKV